MPLQPLLNLLKPGARPHNIVGLDADIANKRGERDVDDVTDFIPLKDTQNVRRRNNLATHNGTRARQVQLIVIQQRYHVKHDVHVAFVPGTMAVAQPVERLEN